MRNLLLISTLLAAPLLQAGTPSEVERGAYLARAADCVACHSTAQSAPYAGGLPLESPFGTIYGSNITPDKQYGIGNYSREDFYNALAKGKRADGANLYPAMPYTSYHLIKRADSDAIYAFLMTIEPINRPAPETSLSFPFNLRFGMSLWNWLYADELQLLPSTGKSAQWQQGQYLVEVLGHCGECHTPRSFTGALQQDKTLQGGVILGYLAPSLTADDMLARGWSSADLATFLQHGISAQGSMFNEMYPVLHNSTQYLPRSDHQAMATYLLGEQPGPSAQFSTQPLAKLTASAQRGRQEYLNVCAGCHGNEGQGVPHVAVAMVGNTTLRQADSRNLQRVIDEGIAEQQFTGFERMQPMPALAAQLDDGQLLDLLNYLRQSWGGLPEDISATQVSALRSAAGH
jgi:mono/diheme cytochrome c family protein